MLHERVSTLCSNTTTTGCAPVYFWRAAGSGVATRVAAIHNFRPLSCALLFRQVVGMEQALQLDVRWLLCSAAKVEEYVKELHSCAQDLNLRLLQVTIDSLP